MTQKAKNRGQLIDIARSYLSGDNHVICREDIPEMIDSLIGKVKILDIQRVRNNEVAVCCLKYITKDCERYNAVKTCKGCPWWQQTD